VVSWEIWAVMNKMAKGDAERNEDAEVVQLDYLPGDFAPVDDDFYGPAFENFKNGDAFGIIVAGMIEDSQGRGGWVVAPKSYGKMHYVPEMIAEGLMQNVSGGVIPTNAALEALVAEGYLLESEGSFAELEDYDNEQDALDDEGAEEVDLY
jgi:hypothetical protein